MKLKQFAAQNPSGVTTYWHQSGGSPLWESPVSYPALLKMAKHKAHTSSPSISPVGVVGGGEYGDERFHIIMAR